MGRLAGFKYREVAHKLRTFGYGFDRQGPGSHEVWRHTTTGRKVTLPQHARDMAEERCAPSCVKPASVSTNS
jgi:predicted RNA binding protein YcfA (HicA-like mRNA interferase family)